MEAYDMSSISTYSRQMKLIRSVRNTKYLTSLIEDLINISIDLWNYNMDNKARSARYIDLLRITYEV